MINPYLTWEYQARVNALANRAVLLVDGAWGPITEAAVEGAMRDHGVVTADALFDQSGLSRVKWHWTAGAYGVIGLETRAYNGIIGPDGGFVAGDFPMQAQASYAVGRAASHTLNCNSHAIGLSMDCMAGAKERPFNVGSSPMTWAQVYGLVVNTAIICQSFWIPVTRWSVLSHAEVQPTLGIKQRNKWDVTWLPDMDKPGDPVAVGDRLRQMVRAEMGLIAGVTARDFIPHDAPLQVAA